MDLNHIHGIIILVYGISLTVLVGTDGKTTTGPPSSESSTAGIGHRSLHDTPSYVPPEDFIDPDSTTGDTNRVSPTFDESTPRNVTTQLGQTAYLHCIVNNLGDKTVSWIRRKDFYVLTVGLDTYTNDDRFQVIHAHNSNDWILQIRFAQLRDEGPYECQVSSDPKITFFVNLTVLVSKAVIEGALDIYVKSGSSINLTCVITQSPIPPVFVFWYHDERMINYDSSRGQIAVQKAVGDTALSKLFIKDVQPSDSGNYTCFPSNAEATSITMHVLNGPDGKTTTGPPSSESSTAGIRHSSLYDAPSYVPSEDFIDPDSTTGDTNRVSPTFDESTPRNVTTQLGQTAYLHCIVNNIGDKTVSWIRRKDFYVLTVGLDTYTNDDRFQAIHARNSNDWTLQIKFAHLRDEGPYECQVSSDPKITFFVNLTVLVSKAVIEGAPDIYIKSGSPINLTCVITQSPIPPVFVFWYHDERIINYVSSRGQISVQKSVGDTALSKLFIKDVQPSDSGNYTCCPSNAEATSITVHVLNVLVGTDGIVGIDGSENSTAGIRHHSLHDTPSYVPPEDFIDPDSTTRATNRVSPTFDESAPRNVTTQLGQTAYLHCIVNNLGRKTVSWIRRKDFYVLTVGLDTYTNDDRFQAIHARNSNEWTLQIKFAQLRDEGPYECQVSSDPKITFFVNLTVLDPKAVIEGAPDIYVKSGSSINLTCVITQIPIPPVFVFWYHDERMISYDGSSRRQITVQKAMGDTALSKLFIKDVQPSDSGNYTCIPSNTKTTSITMHVLNGEKPAAMQHDENPGHSSAKKVY